MNKKDKIYLLLIVNVLVWGYVGYKIFSTLYDGQEPEKVFVNSNIKKVSEDQKNDSVILSLNYLDPFLKFNLSQNKIPNKSETKNIKPKETTTKPNIILKPNEPPLDIKYVGLINNNDKNIKTALLNINGVSFFARESQTVGGVFVKKISSQCIELIIGNSKRIISKS